MKNLVKIFLVFFSLGMFFVAPKAFADDVIDVSFDPVGGIHETNIAPGQITILKFTVASKSDEAQDLMLRLSRGENNNLDSMMIAQLRRSSDGVYLSMPNGLDSQILNTINNDTFEFTTLGHRLSEIYELIFTFDPMAGNEYQGKSSIFDLSVGVDAEDADGNGTNGGRANSTVATAGFFSPVSATGSVSGEEVPSGENIINGEIPEVAGAENTECSSWPLWVWILMLAAYIIAINTNFYYEAKEKVRWFFPLVWTAAIFLVWYYFEKCRLYSWYPYLIIIIAIVSFFVYLSWLKRKAKTVLQREDE